ncbi:MAG: restriction endonuclease subunit S [Chloroflexota bacterium]
MPQNWQSGKLGNFIIFQRGFDLPEYAREPGSIPVVTSSGISGYHSTAKVEGPGIVIGRYGTLGEVFYIKEGFWPHNTSLYVKDFKGNEPHFILYFLKTVNYQSHNDKSSVPGLNRNHLHLVDVVVPPLHEQRAIAHVLGSLDDKIELNRKMNATLEELARAIFKSWFVDFDPVRAKAAGRQPVGMDDATAALFPDSFETVDGREVPRGWEIQAFDKSIEIISGGTPKTTIAEYWNGNIPWFSVVDSPTHSDVFVIDTQKKITQLGLEKSPAKVLPAGITIITARGTVGKVAITGVPLAINQSCYGVKGQEKRGAYFTYFALRYLVDDLKRMTHGAVFDTITRETFTILKNPQVPIELTQSYDNQVAHLLIQIKLNQELSQTLAKLRDSLLPKLLSGEIRVRDAEHWIETVS